MRHPLPHSKCAVTIIIVLYIIKINYLLILYIENGQNVIKLHTKTHQIASFFYKNFWGVCPRSPDPLQLGMHAVVIMEACRKFCRGVQLRNGKSLPNGEKCHKRQS